MDGSAGGKDKCCQRSRFYSNLGTQTVNEETVETLYRLLVFFSLAFFLLERYGSSPTETARVLPRFMNGSLKSCSRHDQKIQLRKPGTTFNQINWKPCKIQPINVFPLSRYRHVFKTSCKVCPPGHASTTHLSSPSLAFPLVFSRTETLKATDHRADTPFSSNKNRHDLSPLSCHFLLIPN